VAVAGQKYPESYKPDYKPAGPYKAAEPYKPGYKPEHEPEYNVSSVSCLKVKLI